ncbi:MAG: hypothetical protein MJB14_19160 [Spirochaetes bacterium]|nr:hypothetical protein [Spirochaetota bacterium]
MKKMVFIILILYLLVSCKSNQKSAETKDSKKSDETIKVTDLWVATEALNQPESVIFDEKRNLLYVSNVNGSPSEKDGNGYISIFDLNGNLVNNNWINGLHAPKGMAISQDFLYVSDIDTLVEIDIAQSKVAGQYQIETAGFLNDVAVDNKGNILVTDTGTNSIFQFTQGKIKTFIQDEKLFNPNGIYFDNDQFFIVSWSKPENESELTDVGSLKLLKADGSHLTHKGDVLEGLDGIEIMRDNKALVTNWITGDLYQVNHAGKFTVIANYQQGTADLEYIKSKNIILIPQMNENKLIAIKVN